MTSEQKAAFINAQVQMMIAERMVMEAENIERERKGQAPANGPEQWREFHDRWEWVLGYNAVVAYFNN